MSAQTAACSLPLIYIAEVLCERSGKYHDYICRTDYCPGQADGKAPVIELR